MKWSVPHKDYFHLSLAVRQAFHEALQDKSKEEPQLVANLVWHLPAQLNKLSFSGNYSVKSGGVFVHKSSFVIFPGRSKNYIEIGDLLLVRTSVLKDRDIDRRALLLQAKKIQKLPAQPDNPDQYKLYAEWPAFEYTRSGILNGKKRYVTGLDIHSATKFLLIGEDPVCIASFGVCSICCLPLGRFESSCCSITAQPTKEALTHHVCFFQEIIDFILGDAGKSFITPPPEDNIGWDRVVHDLITVTAVPKSKTMQKASPGGTGRRGQGELLAFCTGIFPDSSLLAAAGIVVDNEAGEMDGPPKIPAEKTENMDNDGGISIIEFVVEEGNEREKGMRA